MDYWTKHISTGILKYALIKLENKETINNYS